MLSSSSSVVVVVAALVAVLCVGSVQAFYLPGVAPREYLDGEPIELKVNKLSSSRTQLPYEYYTLPFCRPEKLVNQAENLGEILFGDRIENALYKIFANVQETCKVLCDSRKYTTQEMAKFEKRIREEYRVHMIIDNLPAATKKLRLEGETLVPTYEQGFRLGFVGPKGHKNPAVEEGRPYINNHLHIILKYHIEESFVGSRIVGFEVIPMSVQHVHDANNANAPLSATCPVTDEMPPQAVDKEGEIVWTYDVIWESSEISWASRWDLYLLMTDDQIHWFSIINSLMIVLFLSGMVALIMLRTLHRDFSRYNDPEAAEEMQEETGWKLVHGDVFRPPQDSNLLASMVGIGTQVFGMAVVTLTVAVLGFLSPANRGSLMTAAVLLFVFMGALGGYTSARLYKMFKGVSWKRNTLLTAFFFPGFIVVIFVILNIALGVQRSSGAVPISTMLSLFALWFGISVPLVFLGSYFGFKKDAITQPVRTNQIPRQVPEQPWYMHSVLAVLLGGVLPFGAIFIELFYILSSIWLHQFYYVFGFLFIVFGILVITCGEITIVMTYFQLCAEDYRWWWRSYLTSASSALYLFIYSLFYFYSKLDVVTFGAGFIFFCYVIIISLIFFALTGAIGFLCCFWFVRKIYGSVKVD